MAEGLLKQLEKPSCKFLVYASAGRHSNCRSWVKGPKRFDLWITSYTDEETGLKDVADYYHERKGGKFPNLHHAYNTWPEILRSMMLFSSWTTILIFPVVEYHSCLRSFSNSI